MVSKFRARRPLSLERLEVRSLLAGDVMAMVIDGNLLVVGDKFDNAVAISQGNSAGDFVVTGHNDLNGEATNINGVPNGAITLHGIKGLVATLMEGSDDLVLDRAEIAKNVTILTGGGNDTVSIGAPPGGVAAAGDSKPDLQYPVMIGGNLVVDLGEGDDQAKLARVSVSKNASVSGGSGDDTIALGTLDSSPAALSTTSPSVGVAGNLFVNLVRGDDVLKVQSISVGHDLRVLSVTGNQAIQLDTVDVQNRLMLITGNGTDTLSLAHITAKGMLVSTGAGADQIVLSNIQVDSLRIFLGEGDDSVHAINAHADLYAVFFGGPGFDTYLDGAGPQPGVVSPRFRRFRIEQFIPLD